MIADEWKRSLINPLDITVSDKMNINIFIVCVCLTCLQFDVIQSSTIRKSSDIDDIIDLDHEYLSHGNHYDFDGVDSTQYYFRSEKGGSYLPLRRNQNIDLNSPLCYVEGENVVCEYGSQKNTHFYHADDHSVAVAIANENGTMKLSGIANTQNETFEFNPLESPGLPHNRYHVIKKRWTANIVHSRSKRGARRKSKGNKRTSQCSTCSGGIGIHIGIGIGSNTRVNSYNPYQTKSSYKPYPTQSTTKGYCVDVLCVVDYSIYKKFKKIEKTDSKTIKKIRYYYAHVINGMNMRYANIASKKLKINIRLAGYFIAKKPKDFKFMNRNRMDTDSRYRVDSNYTLTALDAFLKKLEKKSKKSTVLPDYNHAMFFLEYAATNLGGSVLDMDDHHIDESVYAYAFQHGEPKGDVTGDDGGTSFVSGICSDSKGTSMVVDHGALTSAGIGTHELGHNLGVFFHDGEGPARSSSCNASYNYIMAPASYLIDEKNLKYSFTFSKCSLDQMQKHIKNLIKMKRNCLDCKFRQRTTFADMQIDREVQGYMATLPGEIDDVHKQCQHLYGDKSFMCPPKAPDEMCYRMYCYDPKRMACAIISEQMAVPGTPCGRFKICKMGKCVRDNRGKDVPDDCPYPDLPSPGLHCEDATPFRCKDERFRQKCCSSCNKNFTAEEACKDSHVPINNMNCYQLMRSSSGRPGCAMDNTVQNLCCRSCKELLKTGGGYGGVMIHIGVGGSRLVAPAPSPWGRKPGSRSRFGSTRRKITAAPPRRPPPIPSVGICEDWRNITINEMPCPVLIKSNERYCSNCEIQKIRCCRSCLTYKDKYKC